MAYKKLALILGNCLFPDHSKLNPTRETLFFMAEDHGLCTHFNYHKHKIILFLSAIRSHADSIEANGHDLTYFKLTKDNQNLSFEEKLKNVIVDYTDITEIVTYDIEDHFFEKRIVVFCKQNHLKLSIIDSPGFITTKKEFSAYHQRVNKPFMHTFYQKQRKSLNLLMDGMNNPLHGKWSFDEENRKKLPRKITIPDLGPINETTHTESVKILVDTIFGGHPGNIENFQWATTRVEVLKLLDDFLDNRFDSFGPYEDAIHNKEVFIFHSVLSPYINLGLITPDEIVKKAVTFYEKHNTHYPSVEGFVRQIIGWREFMRGMYHEYDAALNKNFFNHHRKMTSHWYDGSTGLPPLDDSIQKAIRFGYTHHIERLMILGNIMLLCEIDPDEVYKWFMEMYVDSADWVMAPNVYGMSQFSDGGIFATKPYIGGSNYILKMSNYSKKGDWPEVVNGLYWRFIEKNRKVFENNQRMAMMVKTLERMNEDKKNRIFQLAESFIAKVTT